MGVIVNRNHRICFSLSISNAYRFLSVHYYSPIIHNIRIESWRLGHSNLVISWFQGHLSQPGISFSSVKSTLVNNLTILRKWYWQLYRSRTTPLRYHPPGISMSANKNFLFFRQVKVISIFAAFLSDFFIITKVPVIVQICYREILETKLKILYRHEELTIITVKNIIRDLWLIKRSPVRVLVTPRTNIFCSSPWISDFH